MCAGGALPKDSPEIGLAPPTRPHFRQDAYCARNPTFQPAVLPAVSIF